MRLGTAAARRIRFLWMIWIRIWLDLVWIRVVEMLAAATRAAVLKRVAAAQRRPLVFCDRFLAVGERVITVTVEAVVIVLTALTLTAPLRIVIRARARLIPFRCYCHRFLLTRTDGCCRLCTGAGARTSAGRCRRRSFRSHRTNGRCRDIRPCGCKRRALNLLCPSTEAHGIERERQYVSSVFKR
jgi:hypothetical protein